MLCLQVTRSPTIVRFGSLLNYTKRPNFRFTDLNLQASNCEPAVSIPRHISYIVDGNGRWAIERNQSRSSGHFQGAKNAVEIVKKTFDSGVQFVTLFLLSTENWKRPTLEVETILQILHEYLSNHAEFLQENKIQLQVIGEINKLPVATRNLVNHLSATTRLFEDSVGRGRVLILAINYGGRDEIVQACRTIAREVKDGKLLSDHINENTVSAHMFTGKSGIPDPDLVVRSSGEQRISNFMLWQSAYTEFIFVKKLCMCLINLLCIRNFITFVIIIMVNFYECKH